jgi:hypothetical protein
MPLFHQAVHSKLSVCSAIWIKDEGDFSEGEGKKLQETILSVLEPYLDQNYHVYQDNYYNSVLTAEYLQDRYVFVEQLG